MDTKGKSRIKLKSVQEQGFWFSYEFLKLIQKNCYDYRVHTNFSEARKTDSIDCLYTDT